MKILFLIKERLVYGTKAVCYGLWNNCQFIHKKLNEHNIESKVIQVLDANFIDKEVTKFKPTHVILEALWVTPAKIAELAKIHQTVHWTVRIHSMLPFLTTEGFIFDWLNEIQKLQAKGIKVSISGNNKKLVADLNTIYNNVSFTPNIYFPDYKDLNKEINSNDFNVEKNDGIINVGAFGALRPLKNTTQEAIWTIRGANELKKILNFHINVSEYETNTTSTVLKNLRFIFAGTKHKLVEHGWLSHRNFLDLVKLMDVNIALSFSETYCISIADSVYMKVPVVVSPEIEFTDPCFVVNPSEPEQFIQTLKLCLNKERVKGLLNDNLSILNRKNEEAVKTWLNLIKSWS